MLLVIYGFILFFILVTALWFSKQVTHREKLAQKSRSKARSIKQQISEIEEVCDTLNIYDANESLLATIYTYIISLMQNVIAIDPSEENNILLEHYQSKKNKIKRALPDSSSVADNDHQINIVKRHISKTIRHIKQISAFGAISELEASEHITRISKLKVQVEVDAFLMQGEKCEQKQDKITAASYYKHAKELLLTSEVSFDNQPDQIKSISKKIANIFNAQEEDDIKRKKKRKKNKELVDRHPLTTFKAAPEDEDEDE